MSAEAGSAGTGGAAAFPESYPMLLSETGLYSDIASGTLAPGVREFEPQFALWSDGSQKRRFMHLPEGSQIDTTDMDNWVYPVGTQFWKEFSSDRLAGGTTAPMPQRVETRLVWKVGTDRRDWFTIAYIWNAEQTDAVAAPEGMDNANGTEHDVPAEDQCDDCHRNREERHLGPGAVQLSHSGPGVTLQTLIEEGLLSAPPAAVFTVPGDATTQAALGYFHANCGHCHRENSMASDRTDVRMWLNVASLSSPEMTDAYTQFVNQTTIAENSDYLLRVYGGNPEQSEVIRRMTVRDMDHMPPLASELVDTTGVDIVSAWIDTLPAPVLVDGGVE
jgi:hypothetical protein